MPSTHLLTPDQPFQLADLPTSGRHYRNDRKAAEKQFSELRDELVSWQRRWYAEGRRKLLVVLQAMDAGGKDGTIRKVFRGVNPQGVRVTSFKAPTSAELARDFLWRVHQAVPAAGMIGVFNRSHYEDVLVVRVDRLLPEEVWRARYEQINQFEKLLTDTGTTVLKFYLHISADEQKQRFQQRLHDPEKNWKFSVDDLHKRKQWDDYMQAYQAMLERCSTTHAPWYVIPADQKWYRNLAIAQVLVHTLRELDPQFPQPLKNLDQYQVE